MPQRQPHNKFLGHAVPRYAVLKAVISPLDQVYLHMVREYLDANGRPDPCDDDVVSYALFVASRLTVQNTARLKSKKGGCE